MSGSRRGSDIPLVDDEEPAEAATAATVAASLTWYSWGYDWYE